MNIRPKDISEYFGISNTTVRVYEELGLIPRPSRTKKGYRIYTDEHIAYFACVREMMSGFTLTKIAQVLNYVMNNNIDAALWFVNKEQADLQQEKTISKKMMENLLKKAESPKDIIPRLLTVSEMSKATGVPATTIRYWDKVGLLSAHRQAENNYRFFSSDEIKKVHVIYATKFASFANSKRYSITIIRKQLSDFDYSKEQVEKLAKDFYKHLDNINRNQMKSTVALYNLCCQVESGHFKTLIHRN